ncbi:ABC transporter substrate-binding protein [Brenneria sp. g21c3]|uniref:ABC transporter substrate-binding protein n=1 Tax=Brenneria sp. g21c3 TaxID=3093893 RepID=UPI002ECECF30|nr:ABC transporter substrate-binding protein [Brenneria sp. g21c3]
MLPHKITALSASLLLTISSYSSFIFAEEPVKGGTLDMIVSPAPQILTSGPTTAGASIVTSTKIFDGLVSYDFDLNPQPKLATRWEISPDGLKITFHLRKDVHWHDGQAFTAKDVAYSALNVWKVHNPRGRTIFGQLSDVQTPDPYTAVFILSKPAPGILKSLGADQAQVLPAHLYEGKDVLTNPYNLKPVGTGPFKFSSFTPGADLVLVRNPDYWDQGKPYLDKVVFRFISDPATVAAALESGSAQLAQQSLIPLADLPRLKASGRFTITTKGYETKNEVELAEFNLDDPVLSNQKVRQAIAHAIDRNWIRDNIFFGYGQPADTPIHTSLTELHSTDGVPQYPYDIEKAKKLLDEAGYKPGAGGVRFKLTIDPLPYGDFQNQIAAYAREALKQVGIDVTVRTQDFAGWVKRVYTDRDFQMTINDMDGGSDPTVGTHRSYWSQSFKIGVGFSNGAHYINPQMDAILEAAASEIDPAKRKQHYLAFQRLAMTELPVLPLISVEHVTVASNKVHNHTVNAHGAGGSNFASVWLSR